MTLLVLGDLALGVECKAVDLAGEKVDWSVALLECASRLVFLDEGGFLSRGACTL